MNLARKRDGERENFLLGGREREEMPRGRGGVGRGRGRGEGEERKGKRNRGTGKEGEGIGCVWERVVCWVCWERTKEGLCPSTMGKFKEGKDANIASGSLSHSLALLLSFSLALLRSLGSANGVAACFCFCFCFSFFFFSFFLFCFCLFAFWAAGRAVRRERPFGRTRVLFKCRKVIKPHSRIPGPIIKNCA